MKRALPFLLFVSALLAACNGDSRTDKKQPPDEAKVKTAVAPQDPIAQKTEELKKLTPMGLDELSSWLPAELNGIKRSNLTMSSDMGYAVAQADYEKNSKTDMRVTVYDCAGEAGANLYKTAYASKMKEQQETEEGYTKTMDFMGGKAIEHHEKKNKVTTLTYISGSHVLVVVSARNIEPAAVREAAEKIGKKAS